MRHTVHDPHHRPSRPPEWMPPLPAMPPPAAPDPHRMPSLPLVYVPVRDDIAAELLRRRIIVATGPIDADRGAALAGQVLLLDQDRSAPITIHFACSEADPDAATSLAAAVDLATSEVTMIAVGAIEGAAIAPYATAGHRRAHPDSSFVLREPAPPSDSHQDLDTANELHQRRLAALHDRVAAATHRDVADVAADMRRGRFLTATDALAYGLVEELTATQ